MYHGNVLGTMSRGKEILQSAHDQLLHMVYEHGQGQSRFPCLAVAGDTACEMSETHRMHQTQVSSAVHTTKGLQSHQPDNSANCDGAGK